MQLIRLPKQIDIAERELPELIADWMNTKSVQYINICFVLQLWVNMLISSVIKCSTSWMRIWLAQLSLRQEADHVYSTTSCQCSSSCTLGDIPSVPDALVQNQGPPELGDVSKGTEYIWKYPCSIMFRRCVNELQSKYHRPAWNRIERVSFAGHLQIEMIWLWRCPVHSPDADQSTVSFTG